MPMDDALADLLRLTMVPGVGPKTCRALLDHFGTAGGALDAGTHALRRVEGVGPKLAEAIAEARSTQDSDHEIRECDRLGVDLLALGEAGYPEALARIADPPPLLYVRGTIEPKDELAIALVGARRCTPYGLRVADKLAAGLARVGITVVSGLARGIDAAAHRAALNAGGRTLAVVANGLSQVYPPEHADLADEVARNGAVITEFPLRQEPLAGLFPQRNRIISGLSLGVVVIEAAPRSGSLATARHAVEQDREVFAVPGPIDSLSSRGCHGLIRDGARLVETVDDILDELGPLVREVKRSADEPTVRRPLELTLNEQERKILGLLGDQGVSLDELIARTGLGASQVIATLSVLEVRRLVRRQPGGLFIRP